MASSFGFSLNSSSLADVLVLCDGGCDVLLTGVETGLATPVEDRGPQQKVAFFFYVKKQGVLGGSSQDMQVVKSHGDCKSFGRAPITPS